MSHLDMDQFLTENSTQLYGGYKLASGVASVDGKMNAFVSYQRAGETWFNSDPNLSSLAGADRYIAPMQSFIVVPKVNNPNVTANINAMVTYPAGSLRSTGVEEEEEEAKVLDILAIKGEERSKALLIQSLDASNEFRGD